MEGEDEDEGSVVEYLFSQVSVDIVELLRVVERRRVECNGDGGVALKVLEATTTSRFDHNIIFHFIFNTLNGL